MQVARHADERLLHEILCPIGVPRLTGDEVDQAVPIPVVELLEGPRAAMQVRGDELLVGKLAEILLLEEGSGFRGVGFHDD